MSGHITKINVCFDSKIKFYKVKPIDLIKDIKNKIQDKEGFQVKFQYLSYNGNLLEDDKTLSDYSIKNDSTLVLVLKSYINKILIFVQPKNGMPILLIINENEKIEKLKLKIQKKEKIYDKFFLKYRNIILEDGKTLKDYNITKNSIINLCLSQPFEFEKIYIDFYNRIICLNIINGLSKIKDIKEKLSELIFIPFSELVLYLNDMILDDNLTVNLDIDDIFSFKLYSKTILVIIKSYNGNQREYRVSLFDTVENLKMKIEKNENISHLEQCLYLGDNDEEEFDNNKTLNNYSIKNGTIISLYRKKINIFVKCNNKTFTLIVDLYNTTKEVKEMIIKKKGKKEMVLNHLAYGGNIMKNENTLSDYNVQKNSTIFSL